jgi:calcium-dependent protein kinase
MAPEVLTGRYTKQADLWSVGVIAYMLMSSQMPFYGRKRQDIVDQIMAGCVSCSWRIFLSVVTLTFSF